VSAQHTATYLNDHLAGSVVALELLTQLEREHAGPAAKFAAELRADIEPDRDELARLMERLSIPTSGTRKAVAWFGEKVAQLKMRLDDKADGALRLLEMLEALAVGIEGKRMLWTALQAASLTAEILRGPDYSTLIRRAAQQRERVERFRLEAAIGVLEPRSPTTA
jgi:hypothetical protein